MLTRLILGGFCCFSVANGKGWEVDDEVVFSARVVCNMVLYGDCMAYQYIHLPLDKYDK